MLFNIFIKIVIFFLILGYLTSYFSKNMIVVMLAAIILTNLFVSSRYLGQKPLLEGMKNGGKDNKEVDDVNAPVLVEISISGELLEINDKYLSLLPTIGANEIIKIPMNKVTSVTRNIIPNGVEDIVVGDKDFRVLLRDGSELIGEPTSLNEESLILFLKDTESSIPLPINEIIRIDREKVPEGSPDYSFPEFPKKHNATLSTGEVISGQLLPSLDSDNWLRISSPILSSEVPLSLVNSLVFPASQETLEEVERQLAEEIKVEQDGNNKVPQDNKIEVDEPEEIKVEIAEPKIRILFINYYLLILFSIFFF